MIVQDVVEIMREAGGQPANAFHLLRLVHLQFSSLAIGDVSRDPDETLDLPKLPTHGKRAFANPANLAIRPKDPVLLVIASADLLGHRRRRRCARDRRDGWRRASSPATRRRWRSVRPHTVS